MGVRTYSLEMYSFAFRNASHDPVKNILDGLGVTSIKDDNFGSISELLCGKIGEDSECSTREVGRERCGGFVARSFVVDCNCWYVWFDAKI
jgi:hypothetical protein